MSPDRLVQLAEQFGNSIGWLVVTYRTGLAIGLIAALVLCWPLAKLTGSSVLVMFGVLASLAAIGAFTLTPGTPGFEQVGCIYNIAQPTRSDLVRPTDISLNILLFIPLGLFLSWLRKPAVVVIGIALAALLPFAIEFAQLRFIPNRSCSFYDVATNLSGLVIGVVLGLLVRAVVSMLRR